MFGKDHREKSHLRVNDLICDVLSLVNGEVKTQQVVVQLELDERVPEVLGDRTQLQQVLLNLFTMQLKRHGRLWAAPDVPHGCIFSITLPVSAVERHSKRENL